MTSTSNSHPYNIKEISAHCNEYKGAVAWRSIFQVATTLGLFIASIAVMLFSLQYSYWVTLLLAFPTAGLLARIFIFQHDCGHRSFFNSKKVNDWVGRSLSALTLMPYDFWRRSHNLHHATSGNLERCGIGGIDTLTVKEYKALPAKSQFFYRLYRNPFLLLLVATPLYIILMQRVPYKQPGYFRENYKTLSFKSTWKSILYTDAYIVAFYALLISFAGLSTVLLIAIPVLIITSWFYGWAFFIQHQFEETYWETDEKWNMQEAALMGSSYYKLPKIVQWFSGNIGIHHIHHLCSQIPNYKLQKCIDERPELKDINQITFLKSLKCANLKLWDEDKGQLVKL